jgi:hypothetical protein
MTIGPRQMMGSFSSTRNPIDMHFTPCASSGTIFLSAPANGRSFTCIIIGSDGP